MFVLVIISIITIMIMMMIIIIVMMIVSVILLWVIRIILFYFFKKMILSFDIATRSTLEYHRYHGPNICNKEKNRKVKTKKNKKLK